MNWDLSLGGAVSSWLTKPTDDYLTYGGVIIIFDHAADGS